MIQTRSSTPRAHACVDHDDVGLKPNIHAKYSNHMGANVTQTIHECAANSIDVIMRISITINKSSAGYLFIWWGMVGALI